VGIDIEMVVVQACGLIADKVEFTLYGVLRGFRFATRVIQCCVPLCPSCKEGEVSRKLRSQHLAVYTRTNHLFACKTQAHLNFSHHIPMFRFATKYSGLDFLVALRACPPSNFTDACGLS
jgi:hypothetical protein